MNSDDLNRIWRKYGDGTTRTESKIIGAPIEKGFPSVCRIAIRYQDPKNINNLLEKKCTGTLIAPRIVLFANHCVSSIPKGLLKNILVTFETGAKGTHTFNIGPASLFHPKGYDVEVVESGSNRVTLQDKLRMSGLDYAIVVLPKSVDSSFLTPMPMMPLKNLKILKDLGKIKMLTAVGYGKYSEHTEVNREAGVQKRKYSFSEWEILPELGIVKIKSTAKRFKLTQERINIAQGDSGGPIFAEYNGVMYLVATVAFFANEGSSSNVLFRGEELAVKDASYNVSVDFPVFAMLKNPKDRNMKFYPLFNEYRQSKAPYGYNYEQGLHIVSYLGLPIKVRNPKLPLYVEGQLASHVGEIEKIRLYKDKKWFQKEEFKFAVACAPLVIYAIMGIRLSLDFNKK